MASRMAERSAADRSCAKTGAARPRISPTRAKREKAVAGLLANIARCTRNQKAIMLLERPEQVQDGDFRAVRRVCGPFCRSPAAASHGPLAACIRGPVSLGC